MRLGTPLFSNGLSYYRKGSGEPVLLIHGVGLCAASWYQQFEYLSNNFEVTAIDLPGHGDSEALSSSTPSTSQYAESIVNFVRDAYPDGVHVVGHSLGALIAINIACYQAKYCRSLLALTSIYQRNSKASNAVRKRAATLATKEISDIAITPVLRWFPLTDENYSAVYVKQCTAWLQDANTKGYATAYHAFAHASDCPSEDIGKIECPALYISGELDPNSTPEMSTELARLSPQGEAMVIKNARHMLQLTHADIVNLAIETFLSNDRQTLVETFNE